MSNNKLPTVVLFGRTNVGKSSLFNRLVEKNSALTADVDGTTRDCNIDICSWRTKDFCLVDTGGILDPDNLLRKNKRKAVLRRAEDDRSRIDILVQQKVREYIQRADLIIFVVDAKTGLLPGDKNMAKILKKNFLKEKNIILAANKVDSPKIKPDASEFYKLGLGEPLSVSAATGSGTGDLLDAVHAKLRLPDKAADEDSDLRPVRVLLAGKPNVGKSSLVNALLDEPRLLVSPVAHTTREPNNIDIMYKDRPITLIDTAGISKQARKSAKSGRIRDKLDKKSILRSLASIDKADVVLLVVDIHEGLSKQEAKLTEEIISRGKSLVIIANKWDLVKEKDTKAYTQNIYRHLPFVRWAPVLFVSALTGAKTDKILDLVLDLSAQRSIRIEKNALSKFLHKLVARHKPAKSGGTKHPFIHELLQVRSNPPKFTVRIGAKDSLSDAYVQFIKNSLRRKFEIGGTPIMVEVIRNRKIHSKAEERGNAKKQKG